MGASAPGASRRACEPNHVPIYVFGQMTRAVRVPVHTRSTPVSPERLQKVLASAGIASRRDCEELIAEGRVSVNEKIVRVPGTRVDMVTDVIAVDGQILGQLSPRTYLMLHKPAGVISTTDDPQGRTKVIDLVQSDARLFPVGRLDFDSEGLILLTDDGELTQQLTHPSNRVEKEYRALLNGAPDADTLREWRDGVVLDGTPTTPAWVEIQEHTDAGHWIRVVLHEGRKRQIREVARLLGFEVLRLIRVREGPLLLGALEIGAHRPLTEDEVTQLREHAEEQATQAEKAAEDERRAQRRTARTTTQENRPMSENPEDTTQPARPAAARRGAYARPSRVIRAEMPETNDVDAAPATDSAADVPRMSRPARDNSERPRRAAEDRPDRAADGERPQREGGRPRDNDQSFGDRPPRGDGGYRPRGDSPPRDGGFRPRDNDRPYGDRPRGDGPPREGGFRPRDNDRPYGDRPRGDGPPREGGFRPRDNDRPYGDRPRSDGPPRDGGYRPRSDGPPRDGGFRPRPYGDRPPREGGFRPRDNDRPRGDGPPREGGFRPRPYDARPPRDGGFRPRDNDRPRGDGPPREGGFRPRDNDRPRGDGPPREGGFRPRDNDRPRGDGPPREGGFRPRPRRDDEGGSGGGEE